MALDGATRLAEIGIPHWPMLLEQAFAALLWQEGEVLAEGRPETVAGLAQLIHRPLGDVIDRLTKIKAMTTDIEISPEELHALLNSGATPEPLLLDVRENWEFAICRIAGSLLLGELSLAEVLAELRARPRPVVTICHHGVRSLSAALYLKEQGIASVQSLAGGVDLWARRIDQAMPTY